MNDIAEIGPVVWLIVKLAVLVFLILYFLFSIVVVRQVKLMSDTLDTTYETAVKRISYLHLLIAFSVFILALVIL